MGASHGYKGCWSSFAKWETNPGVSGRGDLYYVDNRCKDTGHNDAGESVTLMVDRPL